MHKYSGIFDERNFTNLDQPVETNTYQTLDSEEAANITSDCNLPYGQSQIFKGSLEFMNQAFVEIGFTDPFNMEKQIIKLAKRAKGGKPKHV